VLHSHQGYYAVVCVAVSGDLNWRRAFATVYSSTGYRLSNTDPSRDQAGAAVFDGPGRWDYLSSFVRPLFLTAQKKISVPLNDQKVRFK
jgi:hypothetical protein